MALMVACDRVMDNRELRIPVCGVRYERVILLAISTCMGAFLLLLPRNKIEFKFFGLFFFRPFSRDFFVSAWIVMSFWFLSDLFWGALEMASVTDTEGTAFGAHVGGFLLGMAALGLLKLWWRSHPPAEAGEPETVQPATGRVTVRAVFRPSEERPYIVAQLGQEFGPYSLEEVTRYVAAGSIIADAHCWREGMAEWQPISRIS